MLLSYSMLLKPLDLLMLNLLKSSRITVLCVSLAIGINAQAYDANDQAVLRQNIHKVSGNMVTQDYEPIINMISPKVLAQLANSQKTPIEAVKRQLVNQSQRMMQAVAAEGTQMLYSADLESGQVFTSQTGREYIIIPTQTQMIKADTMLTITGTLLAFKDEGLWYMIRIDSPRHVMLLSQAYPDMTDIAMFAPIIKVSEVLK